MHTTNTHRHPYPRVRREGKRLLKESEDRRRRMSVLTRRDVRQNNVEGAERLKQMAKDEDVRLLEERKEGVEASREMKRKMQEDRRQSFAGR